MSTRKKGPEGQGLNYPARKSVVALVDRVGRSDHEYAWWGDALLHAGYVTNAPGDSIDVNIAAWAAPIDVNVVSITDELEPLTATYIEPAAFIAAGLTERSIVATLPFGEYDISLQVWFDAGGSAAVLEKISCYYSPESPVAGTTIVYNEKIVNMTDDENICLSGLDLSSSGKGQSGMFTYLRLNFMLQAAVGTNVTVNYKLSYVRRAA